MEEGELGADHPDRRPEDKILYDLLVCCKWPEVATGLPADEGASLWRSLASLIKACFRFTVEKVQQPLRALTGGSPSTSIPTALLSLIGAKLSWQLALSSDAAYLAVLKEDALEIRNLSDGFKVASTEIKVPLDAMPTWRKIIWSPDNSLVAIAMSNGEVLVLTRMGKVVCRLLGKVAVEDVGKATFSHAVAGMAFLPSDRKDDDGSMFCVMFYNGLLEAYHLRDNREPEFLHSFSFADFLPCGVSTMVYYPLHKMLIVGSSPQKDVGLDCVSGWRLLDAPPYWAPKIGQETQKKQRKLFSTLGGSTADINSMVFQMSVSPSGSMLASIDVSGNLSLWELPSFRLKRKWTPHELPQVADSDTHNQKGISKPLDVCWWSDEALILMNTASQVFVLSVMNLDPLLREISEQGSCITQANAGQFLMLQCESRTDSLSRVGQYDFPSLSEDSDSSPEQVQALVQQGGEGEEEEEQDNKMENRVSLTSSILKQILFFLTENERFRPPRKKQKVLYRTHLLTCLKSMTPEECYERKMANEEYEDALVLAQQYGLNCDLVYLKQWHSYPVTMETIETYLAKISDYNCVLKECSSRVPDDYTAARELLLYGLSRTSFSELCNACGDDDEYPLPQHRSSHQDSEANSELGRAGSRTQAERGIDHQWITMQLETWDRLTSMQFSICQNRNLLLSYLDRLSTYEVIAGSESLAAEQYGGEEFEEFRSGNLVKIAVSYARENNFQALEALFTYHGELLLPHCLTILSNFPETTSPQCYKQLLPTLNASGGVEDWKQSKHRSPDWVESEALRRLCHIFDEAHSSHADFLYEDNPDWKKYINPSSNETLSSWFTERATEIEELSGQVDSALELVVISIEKGVKGLSQLHHHLQTLYTLVYKSNADCRLSLRRLQGLTNLDIVHLMLKESEGPSFISDFVERVVPFITRLEELQSGSGRQCLSEYMTTIAKDDLEPCLAVFLQSTGKGPKGSSVPVIEDSHELVELALKCVYASKRGDQIDIVEQIKDCLKAVVGSVEGLLTLEKYISVAVILQCYGVKKPICYIQDNEANVEEARQLMIKLTRVASRQDPPMTKDSLEDLLQDMLTLQTEVFTCINQDACHKIFTESLLCSNDISKISLAGDLLTVTPSPASPRSQSPGTPTRAGSPMNHFNYSLSYETSLELVHNAAKEYFNSAQSFMDDDMNLARKCLNLFPTPPPPELRSELNLIASLSLLDDFGIKMLPVQVRLCENKLDLIRNCLDSSPTAYKSVHVILQLSKFLGLDTSIEESFPEEDDASNVHLSGCMMSEGRGHSLIFITLTALQTQDFKLAYQLCSELVEACFPPAWEVCRSLALDGGFSDLPAKLTLLNFAITHCPPEEIVHILKERQMLEAQLLAAKHNAVTKAQQGSVGQVGMTTSVGHGVQQVVRKGAGAIQQLIGQRLGSELSPAGSQHSVMTKCIDSLQSCSEMYLVKDKIKATPSCHPFSSNDGKEQQGGKSVYNSFDPGHKEQSQSALEALLRAKLLSTDNDDQKEDCTEVLLKLAEGCSESDTHLMLGYLLAITKAEDSAPFFSKLVPSKFSLELAIYYTCLQLYVTTASLEEPLTNPHPYLYPPVQLVEHVTSHETSSDVCKSHPHVVLLRKYQELLDDYSQGQVLLGLGLGIDVEQFTNDPSYKRDIILSLARSLNPKVCLTSLSLARHHSIPEWEVYMSMMDCILTSAKLSASDMQHKIKELGVLDSLLKCPQETADYLRSHTYAKVPGNKYPLLIQYFTLLEQCAEHGATIKEDISMTVHLQLLKKFKSALPSIDYKQLMCGEGDPLLLLTPLLSSSNVHVVAKVASKIPCQGDGTLSAGMVFSAYALKLFWKGEGKGHEPHSTADWLHRFESCHDYLVHLNAQELHHIVLGITLSQRSLKFKLETRTELMKRAIKFTQQMIKKDSTSEKRLSKDGASPYEDIKHEFERILVHLQNLSSPELQSETGGIDKDQWKKHLVSFDLSGSDTERVHYLALEMVADGVSLNSVQLILSLANTVNPHKIDVSSVVNEALTNCLNQLELPQAQTTTSGPDYTTLERILSSLSLHESENSSIDVLSILKSFCGDYTKPANVRRAVLLLIEKYLVLPDEEHRLLLLYQTQSVLLEQFETEASLADISSVEAQQQLFTSLLTKADSVDKLLSLMTLLDSWENQQLRSSHAQCWVDLLHAIANRPEDFSYVTVVRAGLKDIPSEVDHELFTALSTKSWGEATKFSLVCSNEDMFKTAIENLVQVRPIASEVNTDLLELILVRRKVGVNAVVNGPLFPLLCDYIKAHSVPSLSRNFFSRLLHCSEAEISERLHLDSPAERLKDAVQQVQSSGLIVEAGSLLLGGHSLHPAVATLNNTLEYLRRMI